MPKPYMSPGAIRYQHGQHTFMNDRLRNKKTRRYIRCLKRCDDIYKKSPIKCNCSMGGCPQPDQTDKDISSLRINMVPSTLTGPLYRGADLKEFNNKIPCVDDEYVTDAFTSTSRKEDVAVNFSKGYLIEITVDHGVRIYDFRDYEGYRHTAEEEVLLDIKLNFRITEVKDELEFKGSKSYKRIKATASYNNYLLYV